MPRRETRATRVRMRAGEDWQAKAVRLNTLERNLLRAYLSGLALEQRLRLALLRQQTRPVERRSAALKTRLKSAAAAVSASALADDELNELVKQFRPPAAASRFSATIRAYSTSMQRHLPSELLAGRRLSAAANQRDPMLGPSSDICPFCVGCKQPIARPLTGACIGGRQRSPTYAHDLRAPHRVASAGAVGTERLTPEQLAHDERDRPAFWFQAPATSTRSRSRCTTHPRLISATADRQQSTRGAQRRSRSHKSDGSCSPSASAPAPGAASNDTLVMVNEYLQSEEQLAVLRGNEEAVAEDTAQTAQNGLYRRAAASAPARRSSVPNACESEPHSALRGTAAEAASERTASGKERACTHVRLQSPEPNREAAAAVAVGRKGDAAGVGGKEGERPTSCGSSVSESASAAAGGGADGGGRREEARRFVIPQLSLVNLERARLASCLARSDAFIRRAFSGASFVRPYSGHPSADDARARLTPRLQNTEPDTHTSN